MQGSSASGPAGVLVQRWVPGFLEEWVIGEPVPEAGWHDDTVELLKALLAHWIFRTGLNAEMFRNLAIRVREDRPNVGFDPDLALVVPAPPEGRALPSLKLWKPGHAVPRLVIEVVSPGHPYKDYLETPDRCAVLGVSELVVFDPMLVGPAALGGPKRLQVWQCNEAGAFGRVGCGDGPFPSNVLGAHYLVTDDGARLRVADQPDGTGLWPTPAEAERAEKERALARVAELEAELGRRPRG